MQTIYYTTSNFIHHTGNVVDLNEYRRKLALAEEGSLAPQPEYAVFSQPVQEPEAEAPAHREARPRRSARRSRRAWALELCTSLSVLVMTMTFTVRILMV